MNQNVLSGTGFALDGLSAADGMVASRPRGFSARDPDYFNGILLDTMKLQKNHSPPFGRTAQDELAAEASSSFNLQNLLATKMDSELPPMGKNGEARWISGIEITRPLSAASVVKDNIHKLAPEVFDKLSFGEFKPELLQRIKEELLDPLSKEARRVSEADPNTRVAFKERLRKDDLPFEVQFDTAASDAFIHQLWPLPDSRSIFDRNDGNEVPYNPDRENPGMVDTQLEQAEWDQQFEAEWAQALVSSDNSSNPDLNFQSLSLAGNQSEMSSRESDRTPVPNGDRLFEQLVSRAKFNIDNDNYGMTLELHPENLGRVSMKVSLEGDKMSARFLVENNEVKQLLLSRIDELKSALEKNGVSMDKLEILAADKPLPTKVDSREMNAIRREPRIDYTGDWDRIAYFNHNKQRYGSSWLI